MKSNAMIPAELFNLWVFLMNKTELKNFFAKDSLRPELAIRRFYESMPNWKSMIDLGANNGFHSVGFARSHDNSKVYAVEANKDTFHILIEKIIRAKLASNIFPLYVAVQDKDDIFSVKFNNCVEQPGRSGILPFWFGVAEEEKQGMTYEPEVDVPATTVDNIVRVNKIGSLDFIKADLEGGEYKAFLGSLQTLKLLRPAVVFGRSTEAENLYGYNRQDWFKLFDDAGYILVTFFGDRMSLSEYYDFWYFYAFPSEEVNYLAPLVKSLAMQLWSSDQ